MITRRKLWISGDGKGSDGKVYIGVNMKRAFRGSLLLKLVWLWSSGRPDPCLVIY